MNTVLTQRKYRIGLQWAGEVGKSSGLWAMVAFAVLQLVQIGLRLSLGFEGDFSVYLLGYGPFLLTAIAWVSLLKTFPAAITAGMTRKEFFGAFAVFSALVIAGGVAFIELVRACYNLLGPAEYGSLDFGGISLLETLILVSVNFTAGAACGAVMARFNARPLSALLAGLFIAVLLLRTIPYELFFNEFADGTFEVEFPGSKELFAPFDAVLAVVFALIVWPALARAPMPQKKA